MRPGSGFVQNSMIPGLTLLQIHLVQALISSSRLVMVAELFESHHLCSMVSQSSTKLCTPRHNGLLDGLSRT